MATGAHAQALENIHRERMGRGSTASQYDEDIVPPVMKRAIAVYEAARVLMGFITPGYDEISQVSQPTLHFLHSAFIASVMSSWALSRPATMRSHKCLNDSAAPLFLPRLN